MEAQHPTGGMTESYLHELMLAVPVASVPVSAMECRMTNSHPSPRVMIIGIDGGSFDIIDPLISDGLLPNIEGLLRRAASAATTCTWPAHTAPGWSTFVTACQPGGHGIYQFFDTQHPGYAASITTSARLGRSSVWDWLAAQDYTLGLVNIPMSHPPRNLPGYQITWPLENSVHYCSPRTLLGDMARHGAHFQSDLATMFRGDYGYLDEAVANVAARSRSISYLLRSRAVDVVMAVFTEADRVGHHYWHYADPAHPRYEAAPYGTGWDEAITRIYRAIDTAIGEITRLLDDDTIIVLVSDHGLGTGRHALSVHTLLEQAGLLSTRRPAGHGTEASWFSGDGRAVDFSRTRVYLPVPGSYGLNINLRGRQRDGIVPAAERERLRDEVAGLMREVRLPDGGKAFRDVVPRELAYPGPHTEAAPDLVLIPQDESMIVVPDLSGELWAPSWQTGLHRHTGMWAQISPNVMPGRLDGPISLASAVPTLLTELGARWPDTVHGRPVLDALTSGIDPPAVASGLDQTDEPYLDASAHAESDAEEEFTSQRLREMGYI
jgi:predicted AlkP superfamily phosphohydrolase/phosphomutase